MSCPGQCDCPMVVIEVDGGGYIVPKCFVEELKDLIRRFARRKSS